jgi:hypothetical protein
MPNEKQCENQRHDDTKGDYPCTNRAVYEVTIEDETCVACAYCTSAFFELYDVYFVQRATLIA